MRLLLATAFVAALAMPAFADPTTTSPAAPAAPTATVPAPAPAATPAPTATKEDEGVICKMKQVTGSRFGVKVCTTKAERENQAQSARDMLAARAMAAPIPGS